MWAATQATLVTASPRGITGCDSQLPTSTTMATLASTTARNVGRAHGGTEGATTATSTAGTMRRLSTVTKESSGTMTYWNTGRYGVRGCPYGQSTSK